MQYTTVQYSVVQYSTVQYNNKCLSLSSGRPSSLRFGIQKEKNYI